jgi:Protein of unknown function (DUF3352)
MVRLRLLRIGLLVTLALAVSGCGANEQTGSVPAGADFAPASSAVYISGVTDPSSSQWKQADKLLGRFPVREKLLASARKDLQKDDLTWERDVEPALGDELSLVLLDVEDADHNYVFFTKPKDEAKFAKVIEAGDDPQVHRKIDGWTVFADNEQSIDNFVQARSSGDPLSGKDEFRDAMGSLSEKAALRGYVSGESISAALRKEAAAERDTKMFEQFSRSFGKLESLSFSTAAEEDGVAVEAAYSNTKENELGNYEPELDKALPSGALLYFSFGNLEDFFNSVLTSTEQSIPQLKAQRSRIEDALGFELESDLFPLFSKEGAIAVYRGGEPTPNVLLVLSVPDEAKAQRVVDRLAALASLSGESSRTIRVHGVDAKEITIAEAGISVFAAVTDGKAFVTSSKAELERALGDTEKLADDAVYREARDAAGAPGETAGFVYANLEGGLPPLFFKLADLAAPGSITSEVRANTKPLRSAVFYAKQDGKRTSLSGFLTIK